MTDSISRSAVLPALVNHNDGYLMYCDWHDSVKECQSAIDSIPSLDAVPVVRCKDCRYSEPMKKHGVCKFGENAMNCTQFRGDDGYGYAGISVIHPDDYCSDGAPKDGEADG